MIDNSVRSTLEHIKQVQLNINEFTSKLIKRGIVHDESKLDEPEVSAFARLGGNLATSEYNSKEYHDGIKQLDLSGALTHHYEKNAHHPEHHQDGVWDMSLLDLVEMFCDWQAAVLRQENGDLLKSIDSNAERFHMSPQLASIFRQTARFIGTT